MSNSPYSPVPQHPAQPGQAQQYQAQPFQPQQYPAQQYPPQQYQGQQHPVPPQQEFLQPGMMGSQAGAIPSQPKPPLTSRMRMVAMLVGGIGFPIIVGALGVIAVVVLELASVTAYDLYYLQSGSWFIALLISAIVVAVIFFAGVFIMKGQHIANAVKVTWLGLAFALPASWIVDAVARALVFRNIYSYDLFAFDELWLFGQGIGIATHAAIGLLAWWCAAHLLRARSREAVPVPESAGGVLPPYWPV